MKVKTSQIPHRPKELYVRLYCKEKNSFTAETIQTAIQSWISLRESSKQKFRNTTTLRRQIRNAQKLKNASPFLPEKPIREQNSSRENNSKTVDNKQNNVCVEDSNLQQETLDHNIILNTDTENVPCVDDSINSNGELPDTSLHNLTNADEVTEDTENVADEDGSTMSNREQTEVCIDNTSIHNMNASESSDEESTPLDELRKRKHEYDNLSHKKVQEEISNIIANTLNEIQISTEPIPPAAKNRKELFNLLNKDSSIRFEDLSELQKRAYTNALVVIKKKYIMDYKNYLEALSNEQLYEHYLRENKEL